MRTISVGIDDRDMVAIEAEAREKKTAPEAIAGLKIKDAMRRGVLYAKQPELGTVIYKSVEGRTRRGVVVVTASPPSTPSSVFKRKRPLGKAVQFVNLPAGADLKVYSVRQATPAKEVAPSRADRKAALMKLRELWNADPANPIDGVEYQKAMRAEWR